MMPVKKSLLLMVLVTLAACVATRQNMVPVVQLGHSAPAVAIAFSPDGKLVLSGSDDGTMKLWEVATGREIRTFSGIDSSVTAVAYSPDGRKALAGYMDGTLALWEISTGRKIRSVKAHSAWIQEIAFSPDGRKVISGSNDSAIKVSLVSTGESVQSFRSAYYGTGYWKQNPLVSLGPNWYPTTIAFSSDSRLVLIDSLDTRLFSARRGKKVLSLPKSVPMSRFDGAVNDAAFSPDGRFFLLGGTGLELRDVATGREIRTFQGRTWGIQAVAFSPDGRFVVTAYKDGTLILWDVPTGREIRSFTKQNGSIHKIVFSPDGRFAVTGNNDGTLALHEISSGRQVRVFKSESMKISALACSPKARLALSGARDGSLTLWDIKKGKRVRTFKGHVQSISSLAYSNDGRLALSGSHDGTARLWDMEIGKGRHILKGHDAAVTAVAFSPDSRTALSGSKDQTCRMWDLQTGKEIKIFRGHANWVNAVTFSSNGRYIVTGSSDSTVKLWEVASGRVLHTFDNEKEWVQSVAVSPDGRYVLAGGWQDFTLWETATRRKVRSFEGHTGNITSLAVSSDGERVVSGSDDHSVKLWNARTGRQILSFAGHRDEVRAVAFSRDDRTILSGGADMTTRIWSAVSGREIVRMVSSRDGEWIIVTPDGYYDTSLEGGTLLHWVYPGGLETYTFEQFESHFKRPGVIRARLAGDAEAGRPAPALTRPPRIEISAPTDIRETDNKRYPLTLRASAQEAVRSVRIFTNGKPTTEVSLDKQEETLSLEVPLFAGANRITAIAYDAKGFSSNPHYLDVICRAGDTARPKLHVLGIGISRYPNLPAKWQLEFAHTDARSVVKTLQRQKGRLFGDVEARLLVDNQASVETIMAALEDLASASENDVVLIFMAGHGVQGKEGVFYFLTSDGHLQNPAAGGLSWANLGRYLEKIKGRTILMLDACHSGSIVTETVVPNDELARDFFSGRRGGVMVFSASKGRQYSFESPDVGGGAGIFTYALIQGLGSRSIIADRDKNGYVELMELVDYVSGYVDQKTYGQQTPWLSRKELFGDLPVAAVIN